MVLPASCANGADVSAFDHPPQTLTLTLTRFRTLDPDNKGYIEADKLRNLLTTHGEPFTTNPNPTLTQTPTLTPTLVLTLTPTLPLIRRAVLPGGDRRLPHLRLRLALTPTQP